MTTPETTRLLRGEDETEMEILERIARDGLAVAAGELYALRRGLHNCVSHAETYRLYCELAYEGLVVFREEHACGFDAHALGALDRLIETIAKSQVKRGRCEKPSG